MKPDSAHVVEMSCESELASPRLVAPYFDLVIISTRHKDGLAGMKLHASHGPVVINEPIDERSYPVVP